MKLKMIAAALAIGLSAQAHAIDNGSGADGGGELYLNVWDASGSYTRNLGISINAFNAAVANGGFINEVFAADTNFTSFLAGVSDVSALVFNVVATDRIGAVRNLVTFNSPSTGNLILNTVNRGTVANSIQLQANAYNQAAGITTQSAIFSNTEAAYAGKTTFGSTLGNGLKQASAGSLSDVMEIMYINSPAGGVGNATYSQVFDGAYAVQAYFDGTSFHIAAVPEPEAYAMFLAGLGMVGAIARRRRNLV